jgi:hypothetical protein
MVSVSFFPISTDTTPHEVSNPLFHILLSKGLEYFSKKQGETMGIWK